MDFLEPIPVPQGINQGVVNAKLRTKLDIFGPPRARPGVDCEPVMAPRLAALMTTADVGPFRATGSRPAVDSLREVLADVEREHPDLAGTLGSAGMLCCRRVRGSRTGAWSNHSFGDAIDLLVKGNLDRRADGLVYFGLTLLAPIFNRHGWFWGAGFGAEDGMHFEAGDALVRQWHRDGLFGGAANLTPDKALPELLGHGDRGPEVRALQERLIVAGFRVEPDGVFGDATEMAVMKFQRERGLTVDGMVGAATRKALKL